MIPCALVEGQFGLGHVVLLGLGGYREVCIGIIRQRVAEKMEHCSTIEILVRTKIAVDTQVLTPKLLGSCVISSQNPDVVRQKQRSKFTWSVAWWKNGGI